MVSFSGSIRFIGMFSFRNIIGFREAECTDGFGGRLVCGRRNTFLGQRLVGEQILFTAGFGLRFIVGFARQAGEHIRCLPIRDDGGGDILCALGFFAEAEFGAATVADQYGVRLQTLQLVDGLAVRTDNPHAVMLA